MGKSRRSGMAEKDRPLSSIATGQMDGFIIINRNLTSDSHLYRNLSSIATEPVERAIATAHTEERFIINSN